MYIYKFFVGGQTKFKLFQNRNFGNPKFIKSRKTAAHKFCHICRKYNTKKKKTYRIVIHFGRRPIDQHHPVHIRLANAFHYYCIFPFCYKISLDLIYFLRKRLIFYMLLYRCLYPMLMMLLIVLNQQDIPMKNLRK